MKISFALVLLFVSSIVSAQADIVINEFVASADSLGGIADPGGSYPDWIEIHNLEDVEKDIGGYMLSDDYTEIDLFSFPAGTSIPAKGYLVVWADRDLEEEGFHADFKLAAGGEQLILSAPNGSVLDSLTFGAQETNVAFARVPNGAGPFTFRAPTFAANNSPTAINTTVEQIAKVTIFPNPASKILQYNYTFKRKIEKKSILFLRIFDNNSSFVKDLGIRGEWNGDNLEGIVDISDLPEGFYYLVLKTNKSSISKKFLIQK